MIKIMVTGDFSPRQRAGDAIERGDFPTLLGEIKPLIDEVDYAITNMEAPLINGGRKIKKTGPNLRVSTKAIEALRYAGFNMVTLANNHIMDYGADGLRSTMQLCRENGIAYVGAGENIEEANRIRYIRLRGKIVAFINIAENEWGTTHGICPGANSLNEISAYYQIEEAKQNADYIIVIIHGGHEMYELPSPRMKRLYRWFVDLGVDAVIGHHTHCFCGDEVYKDKPIVYSLGNFIFDDKMNRDTAWNKCVVAILSISEAGIGLDLIPLHQCGEDVGVHMISDLERNAFEQERTSKNMIIADDELLGVKFEKFIAKNNNLYLSYLEPIKNKYVLGLMNRNIIPRVVRGKYKLLLQNLIRTEAHRDVILEIFDRCK